MPVCQGVHGEGFADGRVAQFISAAAVVASNGTYEITAARTYAIFLAILTCTTVVNIWGNKILGKWNDGARTLGPLPPPQLHMHQLIRVHL